MKKVTIMRGLPGSGKSTYLKDNVPVSPQAVCSADHFFQVGEEYKFDPSKIALAHQDCLRKFVNLVTSGQDTYNHVAVDNTNCQLWEMMPYITVAEAHGWEVEIIECWAETEECIKDNVHSVPEAAIRSKENHWEEVLPWHRDIRTIVWR